MNSRPSLDASHPSLNQTILNMMAFHEGQVDKTGVAYFYHPLRVMLRLGDSATDTEKHAALLHDVVEDTTITLEILRGLGYSEDVLEIVELVSKREGETHHSFIYRIIGSRNTGAIRVKLADMIDNSCESRLVGVEEGLANDIRKMIESRYKPAIAMLRQMLEGMGATDDIRTEEIEVLTDVLGMYC